MSISSLVLFQPFTFLGNPDYTMILMLHYSFHYSAHRSTTRRTSEPADIPMKTNAAYEDVTKFQQVQNDSNVYDNVAFQY